MPFDNALQDLITKIFFCLYLPYLLHLAHVIMVKEVSLVTVFQIPKWIQEVNWITDRFLHVRKPSTNVVSSATSDERSIEADLYIIAAPDDLFGKLFATCFKTD
jgi:hypothetical protein